MAVSLKHAFVSPVLDDGKADEVGPNEWNAEHEITTDQDTVLGRVSTGAGAVEPLTPAQVRTLINVEDGAQVNTVDSVNGQTGAVVLDADDIDDAATTNKFATAGQLSAVDALGTIATQDADSVNIDGGAIDGTPVGGTTPAAGAFTTLSATGAASFAGGAAGTPSIRFTSDTDTGIFSAGANILGVTAAGTQLITVDGGTGLVGIGPLATTPDSSLLIAAPANNSAVVRVRATLSGTPYDAIIGVTAASNFDIRTQFAGGNINFKTAGNNIRVQFQDTKVVFSVYQVQTPKTVASLTAAATAGAGARDFVSDATATTFGSVVAGGGANKVPVYCDGANWMIG